MCSPTSPEGDEAVAGVNTAFWPAASQLRFRAKALGFGFRV